MQTNKFELFVKENLPKALKKATMQNLGDRTKYVGSSDIGGCLRKVYMDKIHNIQHDIATLIKFERGHNAESIVKTMLDGLNVQEQFVVEKDHDNISLKAHIDFVVNSESEMVVVECKSVSTATDTPYTSWLLQVQYQLHMLKATTDKNVRGLIVAVNINTGWFKSFEVAYNEALANIAMEKAKDLALALKFRVEPTSEAQNYCASCHHKANCPVMNTGISETGLNDDMLIMAKRMIELNSLKKEIEAELDEKKIEMEAFMRSTNTKKLKVDNSFISLSNDTQTTTFDAKALKESDPESYKKYQKTSTRKGYITIK